MKPIIAVVAKTKRPPIVKDKEYHRRWRVRNKVSADSSAKRFYRKRRREAFVAYGGENPVCKCCGESTDIFLTIDHLNNDGRAHRRRLQEEGKTIFNWLRQNNYPPGFQILCFNCNCGRSKNKGVCPHETNFS